MTSLFSFRLLPLTGVVVLGLTTACGANSSATKAVPASSSSAKPLSVSWPSQGQAALAVDGVPSGTSGGQKPTPTASVAKVMTAYVFLKSKPLGSGAQGPVFSISAEEAGRYQERVMNSETVTPVKAGEKFTERRALTALMVVSANNVAQELARWDAGSKGAFVAKMNATARELGMVDTNYTDPSGFDKSTVSTAADQVRLMAAAMKIPAFREIAGTPQYTAPGDQKRTNGNTLLGREGVVAGKTGFTTPAGANLAFAAERVVEGKVRMVVGVVMTQRGESSPAPAIEAAEELLQSVGTTA